MSRPEDFHHAVMHLVKYVGELANIAEKLDHPGESGTAVKLAREYLTKRVPARHLEICYDAAMDHLVNLAEGVTVHEPTQEAMS